MGIIYNIMAVSIVVIISLAIVNIAYMEYEIEEEKRQDYLCRQQEGAWKNTYLYEKFSPCDIADIILDRCYRYSYTWENCTIPHNTTWGW